MKFLIFISIIIFVSSCANTGGQKSDSSGSAKYTLPDYKVQTLANGLEVLLIQNNKLPLININLLIPAGSINDPKGKEGLAYFTGQLLKMGSKIRTSQQIAESLEDKGSSLSVNVNDDFVIVEASALSKFNGSMFNDFIEVLTKPKYSWSEFSRFRKKLRAQKLKTLDDASSLANRMKLKAIYEGHPYGNFTSGSDRSIRSISQKQVATFYKKYYQPKGATLAVVGDFTQASIKPFLEQLEKQWPMSSEVKNIVPKPVQNKKTKVHLVHKPGAKQTQIRFAHLGISRDNKDFIPIRVMNTILGRGFSSRLLTEVRVKKGLTYTVGSGFDAAKYQGSFVINTFTRHDKVKETIDTVLETVKKYLAEGATDSELNVAKQYLKGIFPRALETSNSVAYNIMLLKYLGVPLTYLNNYTSNVDKVSLADIKRVANEYIKPENLQIILVSDKSKITEQVKAYGDVVNYRHTDLK